MSTALELMGAPGSPYTRKMLAIMRYRHIPYRMLWGNHRSESNKYPEPKVKLLPTFYFPSTDGSLEAVVDSTPIIRRLEKNYPDRSIIPPYKELAFYNDLIEDFGDEWLTKAMFHYRWYHQADRENAGPLLIFWQNPSLDENNARQLSDTITQRQYERLYVVGSNDITAPIIEASYERVIDILNNALEKRSFLFGERPASSDFALYGQLTQLAVVDPTPAQIASQRSPRLRAWLDVMEDLSGLAPEERDWISPEEARQTLAPLFSEIGRVYVPFLLANAEATQSGEKSFETEIDGKPWTQPTFPYQAKCLGALKQSFADLPREIQTHVNKTLTDGNAGALVQS